MKLDAYVEKSLGEIDVEDCNAMDLDLGGGLARRMDSPGEMDEDGWKKAENANPCEKDSVTFSCPSGVSAVAVAIGLGSE